MCKMTESRIKAWQCIGCGKIEAPRPCIGVCQDRPVELVEAATHEIALERIHALESVLSRLARTTPRHGEWERSYLALQQQARAVLAQPGTTSKNL
ncbi:MAG: hypothetical protein RL695_1395 [Pseudomonadota bacterium]|jgi:hypothetical protein